MSAHQSDLDGSLIEIGKLRDQLTIPNLHKSDYFVPMLDGVSEN